MGQLEQNNISLKYEDGEERDKMYVSVQNDIKNHHWAG